MTITIITITSTITIKIIAITITIVTTITITIQVFFGILLEMVHRWWRVMVVYMSGVAAGALAHSIFTPTAFLAGASGGVYAVEYAHLGNLLMNWPEMEMPWLQLFVLLLLIGLDFGYAIWDTYFALEPSNTGHMAHFGGAVAGVLVGVVVLRNLQKETWERYCWWFSLVLFLLVISAGVMLNVFLPVPGFFPEDVHYDPCDRQYCTGNGLNEIVTISGTTLNSENNGVPVAEV
nr:protein rhomboid-like [Penaeus vannamei]